MRMQAILRISAALLALLLLLCPIPRILAEEQLSSDALYDRFRQEYGEDMRFWTVEQKHHCDQIAYEKGLTDHVLHLLPSADEITQEEAVAVAEAAILARMDGSRFHGYDQADWTRCQRSSAMYLDDPVLGPHWEIDFYQANDVAADWMSEDTPENLIATFHVILWNHGQEPQVIFDDPYTMRILYQSARLARGEPFKRWPLEDKARMYQQLLALYDREIQRQGEIPEGIITEILRHVQSLPETDELSLEEAIAQARDAARAAGLPEDVLADCTPAVFFWRDEGKPPVYTISFLDGDDTERFTIEIAAE